MTWLDAARGGIVLAIAVIVCLFGSRVVTSVFAIADRPQRGRAQDDPEVEVVPRRIEAAASQLRAGAWIGMLERLSIFACILSGFGTGIAIVLAVKSLARYPELSARDSAGAAERFIIGTLVSALLAAGGAGLAIWLLTLVR